MVSDISVIQHLVTSSGNYVTLSPPPVQPEGSQSSENPGERVCGERRTLVETEKRVL